MSNSESIKLLEHFMSAWNAHDIDALMKCMTDDCVFYASSGPDRRGAIYRGQSQVRAAYSSIWKTFPDAAWNDGAHFACGTRGVSEWIFKGTDRNGMRTVVAGCDLFQLRGDKIAVKDSFRKTMLA